MDHQTRIRTLAQGALLAALTVIIGLLGFYIPLVGLITVFAIPLPVIVMQVRYGLRAAVLTTVASGMILIMLTGPVEGMLLFSFYGIIGLTFGVAIRRDFSGMWAVLVGSLAVALVTGISFAATFLIVGISPLEIFRQSLAAFETAMGMYENWGLMQPDAVQQMTAMIEETMANLQYIIPGSIMSASLVVSYFSYQVTRAVLRRLGHIIRPMPAFSTWQAPDYLVFVPIGSLVLALTQPWHGSELMAVIGANIGLFGQLYFLIQGLSIMSFYMKRYQMPVIVQVLAGWIIVTTSFLLQIAVYSAMFDSLLDFRRLRRPTKQEE